MGTRRTATRRVVTQRPMTVLHKRADTHNSLGDSGTRTRSGRRGGSLTWLTARRPALRNGRGRRSTPYTKRPNARLQRSGSRRAIRSPRSAPPRNAMPPRRSSRWQASLAGRKMSLTAPYHPHAALPAATADLPSGPTSRPGRQVPQARELDDLCQGCLRRRRRWLRSAVCPARIWHGRHPEVLSSRSQARVWPAVPFLSREEPRQFFSYHSGVSFRGDLAQLMNTAIAINWQVAAAQT
jgi:hypothetical protein